MVYVLVTCSDIDRISLDLLDTGAKSDSHLGLEPSLPLPHPRYDLDKNTEVFLKLYLLHRALI